MNKYRQHFTIEFINHSQLTTWLSSPLLSTYLHVSTFYSHHWSSKHGPYSFGIFLRLLCHLFCSFSSNFAISGNFCARVGRLHTSVQQIANHLSLIHSGHDMACFDWVNGWMNIEWVTVTEMHSLLAIIVSLASVVYGCSDSGTDKIAYDKPPDVTKPRSK